LPNLLRGEVKSKMSKIQGTHSKKGQVIWLFLGYRFGVLMLFWVLLVHEIGPFMPYPLIGLRCLENKKT
jgi:hypothetical protein